MGKYLKSYIQYPAGTIIAVKKYSLWRRFINWLNKKRREYNGVFILSKRAGVGISKVDLMINDYCLFIPKVPLNDDEIKKLQVLLNSCSSIEDYLTSINIVRPNIVDVSNLDNLKYNSNFVKKYLDNEPFFEIDRDDYLETNAYIYEARK